MLTSLDRQNERRMPRRIAPTDPLGVRTDHCRFVRDARTLGPQGSDDAGKEAGE
ncbi:hypothetical protein [Actinomadura rubteroloni]|uniref:hypothetical protein n=1 Tax=Actinomadura rubteroloni TaxID=1926885 RepID=UPI00143CC5B4|nr:hypothetical protein [Actinomadura rubteroloni]